MRSFLARYRDREGGEREQASEIQSESERQRAREREEEGERERERTELARVTVRQTDRKRDIKKTIVIVRRRENREQSDMLN
jgi:hypothetical protein